MQEQEQKVGVCFKFQIDFDHYIIESAMEKYLRDSESNIKSVQINLIKFNHDILQFEPFLPIVVFVVLLQSFQTIATGLIDPLRYQSLGIDIFKLVANVLYPDYYLRTQNVAPELIVLFFIFACAHFLLVILSYRKYRLQQYSRLNVVIHYGYICMSTIFLSPIFLTSATILVCNQVDNPYKSSYLSKQCYTGVHGFLCFLAVITSLYAILSMLYISIFFFDPKPFKANYFSSRNSLYFLGKLAVKLAPPVFIVVDPFLQFDVLYIVMIAGLQLAYIGVFRVMWPMPKTHSVIDHIEFRGHTLALCVMIAYIPLHFTYESNYQNLILIGSLLIGVFLGHHGYKYRDFKIKQIMEMYLEGQIDSDLKDEYENMIYYLIRNVQAEKQGNNDLFFHAQDLLTSHRLKCQVLDCACRGLTSQFLAQSPENRKKSEFFIIHAIVNQLSTLIKNNLSLEIIKYQINFYAFESQNKTIFQLTSQITPKIQLKQIIAITNLFYEFTKFNDRAKPIIDKKQNQAEENYEFNLQRSNVYRYKLYAERILEFEMMCIIAAEQCRHYWQQIIQQDCEINNILRLAQQILHQKQKIEEFFKKKLLNEYPDCTDMLNTYIKLMILVYKAPAVQFKDIFEKYKILAKQRQDKTDIMLEGVQLKPTINTVTLCAAEFEGVFTFNKVSRNILDELSYRRIEVLNQDVNFFLPKQMKKMHTNKIKQYIEKTDEEITNVQRTCFMVDGQNQIIKIFYLAKLMPSFVSGIEIVCFIQRDPQILKNQYYLSYYSSLICSREMANLNGSLITIDERLKMILLGENSDEIKTSEVNVMDIIPEWCIYSQSFTPPPKVTQESSQIKKQVIGAEMVSEETINEEFQIKTLKVWISDNSGGFGQFDNLFSLSQSRAKVSNKKNYETKMAQLKIQQSDTPKQVQNIAPFFKIIVFILAAFCLILVLSFVCFFIQQQQNTLINNNEHFSYYLASLCSRISTIPVLLVQGQITEVAQRISSARNQLQAMRTYERTGVNSGQISVLLKLIENQSGLKQGTYTLPQGILLYLSKASQIQKLSSQSTIIDESKKIFSSNTIKLEEGLQSLFDKSESIIDDLTHLSLVAFVIGFGEFGIIIAIFVAVFIWLKIVNGRLTEIIEAYEKEISTGRLYGCLRLCAKFINQIERKQEQEQQQDSASKRRLETYIEPSANSFSSGQEDRQAKQQQMLLKLKNQVKFQKRNTLKSFLKSFFILLVLGILSQAFFIADSDYFGDDKTVNQQEETKIVRIMLELDHLMYMTGFEPENRQIYEDLTNTQQKLEEGIYQYEIETQINIGQTISTLSEYRGNFQLNNSQAFFTKISESHQFFHTLLENKTLLDTSSINRAQDQKAKLALQIGNHFITILLLYFLIFRESKKILQGIIAMIHLSMTIKKGNMGQLLKQTAIK